MREEPKRLTYDDIAGLTGSDILLQLREYLIAYRVFASGTTSTGEEYGQHNPYDLNTLAGLCANLRFFTSSVTKDMRADVRLEMLLEAALDVQFEMWFINNPQTGNFDTDIAYPFGEDDYYIRRKARTQHECPKRLAFLDNTIAALLV